MGRLTPPMGILAMVTGRIAVIECSKTFGMLLPLIAWWAVATRIVGHVPCLITWLPGFFR
ncbi:hypothetical protein JMM63_16130 [Rhodovulum sulfidophilum]|uniref:hypothetical protein n=1 Tax=Rhodovulum sulfidophilum TaxID=35806 RepID=UPI001A6246BB|nr:hypothetical protein [Rhodovulum sulfidophilum]MBL3597077.1 hypothetical protein [Rhodovulum sulfidophilum]